jgi:hypothetical protein
LVTELEGQGHPTANVEGSIGAAIPFSPNPNNDEPAPKMNTSAKVPSRVLWRRCFLARRRGIVSIARSPGTLRVDARSLGPSKVRAFTRSLYRTPPMATMDFIGIHVKPLYVVVASLLLPMRRLSISALSSARQRGTALPSGTMCLQERSLLSAVDRKLAGFRRRGRGIPIL